MREAAEVEFLILGPLEVRSEGRSLPVTGPKQRALLAILLLHANEVVSADRLIELLWGDDPPATGNAALQMRVSALRKSLDEGPLHPLPSERLVTRSPGYLLRLEPDELDAARFERSLAAGREANRVGDPGSAEHEVREALALWRGDPLADFAYEPFAQGEIARLAELRASAIEERIEAALQLGRHAEVIGELESHMAAYPLRERPRAQFMLALYRSGRQAEALAAFHATRRTLVDELGLEPGAALQRLERQILQQDPSLNARPRDAPVAPPTVSGPLPETRKTVTVAMTVADPLGGARGSAIDPERLRDIGERSVAVATSTFEQHGGVIEPSSGPNLVGVFGIPTLHEDDALRALRATASLHEALARLSDELERDFGIRIAASTGIATGEVVTAGATARPPFVGLPLIAASQLQQKAGPGQILLDDVTRQLTERSALVEPAGLAESTPAWRLTEVRRAEPVGATASDGSWVGRVNELAQLQAAFDRAVRDRTIHLCTVLGPAGIGKSRLAQHFITGITDQATIVTGRCLAYGEGITFWPLREVVWQLAPDGDIAALLTGEADAKLVAERVAGALGISETTSSVEETFWAARRLLETVARERPLVVVVEDIHWAEPTMRVMLEYLATRTHEAPILLLCLARPELLEARPAFGAGVVNATSILLEPLAEDESQALMDDRLGPVRLDPRTRARISGTAEGNPLFIEQLIAMVAQDGELGEDLAIPPTIRAVLAARIERLGPGERAVLECAAVAGREFSRTAVTQLLPTDARPTTGRHLDALVTGDLLRSDPSAFEGDEAFRFRHVLIQQSAYRSIPKRRRAELHEAFADWLEMRAGEGLLMEEVLGYHLEQAYRHLAELAPVGEHERALAIRAVEHLAAAGRRAFKAGDMPASVNLLGRATAMMPRDRASMLELLSDLAFALFEVGELERSSATLGEVIDLGTEKTSRHMVARATVQRAHVEMYRHPEAVDAVRLLREGAGAITILRAAQDDAGLARAKLLVSEVQWTLGSGALATRAAVEAARFARRSGSRREEAWSHGDYGYYAVFGPTSVADGTRQMERWLSRAGGHPVLEANLSGFLAPLEAMDGRIQEARVRLAESRVATERLGLRWQTGTHDLLGCFVEMLADRPVAAEAHLQPAIEMFTEMGDMWFLSILSIERARALCRQRRYDEAFALVERLDTLPADPSASYRIRRSEILGRLLYHRGKHPAGLAMARESVELGARTDFLGFHADSLVALAEILRLDGKRDDAIQAVGSAIELYERKGNAVEARKARGILMELSGTQDPRPSGSDTLVL